MACVWLLSTCHATRGVHGFDFAAMGGHLRNNLPDTMTAIVISEPGGPEVLQLTQRPLPGLRAGEVLVEVACAGVNRPDCLQRAGLYPPPPEASPLPGLEVAGTIVAVGEAVEPEWLGQHVCALANGGGYARYCAVPAGQCLPIPEGLSMAEAAALPETLFTVWHNLFQRGAARDGEVLLVHGGTSGIGSMAVMLGKLFGLSVLVTCGTDEKCAAARALGADHAINYRSEDFVDRVATITGGKGADVILDMVAGSYTPRNLDSLAVEGRLVVIAALGGPKSEINVAKMMVKRQMLTGSTLRPRSDAFKALLADDIAANAWPFVEEGSLRPLLDSILPLAEAAEAHRRMEAGEITGKIVLQLD